MERATNQYTRKKTRRSRPQRRLLSLILALALFGGGFLLGRVGAFPQKSAAGNDQPQQTVSGKTIGSGGATVPELPPESSGDSAAPEEPLESREPTASEEPVIPQKPETPDADSWELRLVNRDHPLPDHFEIPELTKLKNGHAIDSRAYPDLQNMMDAARAEGLAPLICSSFRTWDKQSQLFERKVKDYMDQGCDRETAEEKAAVWVARPGTSEHQMGLAVDIVSVGYQTLDEKQEETAVQQWLMAHSWEYGFILRYPSDKSELTGVGYEPWHYRYVGKEAAKIITEQGICLEEYLEQRGAERAETL